MADLDVGTLKGSIELDDQFTQQLNKVLGSLGELDGTFRRVGFGVVEMGRAMESVGTLMTAAITVPIAGAALAGIKFAADFEVSMTRVMTIGGMTKVQIDGLSSSVLDLAEKTARKPEELADALLTVSRAGFRGAEALDILDKAAQMSAIGLGKPEETTRALVGAMLTFQGQGLTAAKTADMFTEAAKVSNASISTLVTSLARVTPEAAAFNIPFADVLASIATFTHLGASTDIAATGIRAALQNIYRDIPYVARGFQAIGMSVQDFRKEIQSEGLTESLIHLVEVARQSPRGIESLTQIFGNVRAFVDVMATANLQTEFLRKNFKTIEEANGSLKESMAGTSATFAFQWQQFIVQLERVAIEFGKTLLPEVEKLLDVFEKKMLPVIKEALDWWAKLPEPVRQVGIAFGAMAATFGPFLVIMGEVTLAVGHLLRAFGNIALFTGTAEAVAGTGAAAKGAAAEFEAMFGVAATAEARLTPLQAAGQNIRGAWTQLIEVFKLGVSAINAIFQPAVTALNVIWDGIGAMFVAQFNVIKVAIAEFAATVGPSFAVLGTTLSTAFTSIFGGLGGAIMETFAGLGAVIGEAVGLLGDLLLVPLRSIWVGLQVDFENSFASGFGASIMSAFAGLGGVISEAVGLLSDLVLVPLRNIWVGIQVDFENFFTTGFGASIISAFAGLGGLLKEAVGLLSDLLLVPLRNLWIGLQVDFENAFIAIGAKLTPALTSLGLISTSFVTTLAQTTVGTQAVTLATAAWGTVTTVTSATVTLMRTTITGLIGTFGILGDALVLSSTLMITLRGVMSGLALGVVAAGTAFAAWELTKWLTDTGHVEQRVGTLTLAMLGFAATGSIMGAAVGGMIGQMVDLEGVVDKITLALFRMWDRILGIPAAVSAAGLAALQAGKDYEKWRQELEKHQGEMRTSMAMYEEFAIGLQKSGQMTDQSFQTIVTAARGLAAQGVEMLPHVKALVEAADNWQEHLRIVQQGAAGAAKALNATSEAARVQAAIASINATSLEKLTAGQRAVAEAGFAHGQSIGEVTGVLKAFTLDTDLSNGALRQLEKAHTDAAAAATKQRDALKELNSLGENAFDTVSRMNPVVAEQVMHYLELGGTTTQVFTALSNLGGVYKTLTKNEVEAADAIRKLNTEHLNAFETVSALDPQVVKEVTNYLSLGNTIAALTKVFPSLNAEEFNSIDAVRKLGEANGTLYDKIGRLNPELVTEIENWFSHGKTLAQVQAAYKNLNPDILAAIDALYKSQHANQELTEEQRRLVDSFYAAGRSLTELTTFYNISKEAVDRYISSVKLLSSLQRDVLALQKPGSVEAQLSALGAQSADENMGARIAAAPANMQNDIFAGYAVKYALLKSNIFEDNQAIYQNSKEYLEQVAAKAKKTYDDMVADSGHHSQAVIDHFHHIWFEAAEAAAGFKDSWGTALTGIVDMFTKMGQVAGGVTGKILSGVGQIFVGLQAAHNTERQQFLDTGVVGEEGIASALFAGKATTKSQKAAAALASAAVIAQGAYNIKNATSQYDSGLKNAGAGAMAGAEAGAAFGPWGIAVGAAAGFITGIIRGKPEWAKAASEVARDFGTKISDELGKTIAAKAKELHGDRQTAELLNLDKIVAEKGGVKEFGVDKAIEKTRDLFVMLAQGRATVKDVGIEFDKMFGQLVPEALDKTTGLAKAGLLDLIKLSQQAGLGSEEVKKFIIQQSQAATSGITDFVKIGANAYGEVKTQKATLADLDKQQIEITKKLEDASDSQKESLLKQLAEIKQKEAEVTDTISTQEKIIKATGVSTQASASAMAAALVGAFGEFQSQGMKTTDALKAVAPGVDALKTQLEATGLSGGDAFDEISQMVALASDKIAGPAFDAVDALTRGMVGLHNSGLLTQDMFTGMTDQIADTFNSLVDQGYNGDQALRLMQPSLQTIWQLQHDFGYQVDDSTQKLLDQGEKAGLVGDQHRDAGDRAAKALEHVADKLDDLITKLTKDFVKGAGDAADGVNDAFGRIHPRVRVSIDYTSPGYTPGPQQSNFDSDSTGPGGGGGGTDDDPNSRRNPDNNFAGGSGGIRNFGLGQWAMLHGREGVYTEAQIDDLVGSARASQAGIQVIVHNTISLDVSGVLDGDGLTKTVEKDILPRITRVLEDGTAGLRGRIQDALGVTR